ncbi:hypothetical protein [Actinomadura luteofluorescens]|uniref:hypothetical protein n=1 Tax=Actinomadura luteofluorescens TaxID=46163 RepID=UPI002164E1F1|nr:hypothetical protein [Actinomadura glauciflava]
MIDQALRCFVAHLPAGAAPLADLLFFWNKTAVHREGGMMGKERTMPKPGTEPARRKHRVFPWIFLAVQIGFLIWVIAGAQANDCNGDQACEAGTTIGVGLIIALWVAADIILGLTYLVFRLFKR